MNPIPDDELLSAYLDGELSEADRARAERLLAEQPEARQLLEDLRAIRGGFEGLPAHRLEQDFPARVLRSAEREMLADESPQAADKTPAEGHPSATAPSQPAEGQAAERQATVGLPAEGQAPRSLQPSFTFARWRRPMAWAGLALAAGLLLMVFDRNRQAPNPRDQVAHAPSAGSEMRAANEPESQPADAVPLFARDPASAKMGRDEPAKAEKRLHQEADAGLADKPAGLGGRAAGRPESAAEIAAPKAAAAMPAPRGDVAKTAGQKPASAAGPAPARRDGAFEVRQSEMTRNEAQAAGLSLYDVEFKQDGKLVSEPLGENTLIVWCDVDADVADKPEFRQMLASNHIAWEPDRPIDPTGKAASSDETPAIELKSSDKKKIADEGSDEIAGKKSRGAAVAGASAQQQPSDRERRLKRLAELRSGVAMQQTLERAQVVADTLSESNSDYVLVEATEAQLKAVLTEIDRHPEMFLSVNVEPAAEVPAQQAYRSYNRSRASLPQDKTGRLSKNARAAKPKEAGAAAAIEEKEAVQRADAGRRLQVGRAQRVMILQQAVQTPEESAERNKSDSSGAGSVKQEAQVEPLLRKDRGKQSTLGVEAKAATKDATPAKPKALAAPAEDSAKPDGEASPAENDFGAQAGRGYQQALFIFRRVSAPEADLAPAEAGKKPQ